MSSSVDSKFTVLLIGDNNAGKGEILNSFKNGNNFFLTSITGIDKVLIDMEINGQKISLMLWNTEDCSAKKLKLKNYPKVIDGAAFVFDPSNRESFENLKYWVDDVKKAYRTPVQYLIISKYKAKSKIQIPIAQGKKFADSQNSAFALINGCSNAYKAFEKLAKKLKITQKPQQPARPGSANGSRKTPSPLEMKKRLEKNQQKHCNIVSGDPEKVQETKLKTPKWPIKPTKTVYDNPARNGTPQNLPKCFKHKEGQKLCRPRVSPVVSENQMSEESSDEMSPQTNVHRKKPVRICTPQNRENNVKPKKVQIVSRPVPVMAEMSEESSDETETIIQHKVHIDNKVGQPPPNMVFVGEIDIFITRLQELKLHQCSDERFLDIANNIKEEILKKIPFPESKIHLKKVLNRLGDIFLNKEHNTTDVRIIDAFLHFYNKFLSTLKELEKDFAGDLLVLQCEKQQKLIVREFCDQVKGYDLDLVNRVKENLQQILNEAAVKVRQDSVGDLLYFDLSTFKTDPRLGKLGKGAYGTVRLAFNQSIGIVAVKCQQDARYRDKFDREARLLRCASHPNIVQVFGCTELPSTGIAIVMEYMAGSSLSTFLTNPNPFGYNLKLRMCHDMASGLAYLHNIYERRRIAHNDIKPHNVLLTASLICKLSDFGSCEMEDVTCSVLDTRCRGLEYTPAFAAPERIENRGIRTSKAMDVFSFGMTVYCVLAEVRTPPITVKGQRPKIPRCRRFDTEKDDCEIYHLLKDTVERCWKDDPRERPAMVAMRDRLYSCISSSDATICMRQVLKACEYHKQVHPAYDEDTWVPLVEVINTQ